VFSFQEICWNGNADVDKIEELGTCVVTKPTFSGRFKVKAFVEACLLTSVSTTLLILADSRIPVFGSAVSNSSSCKVQEVLRKTTFYICHNISGDTDILKPTAENATEGRLSATGLPP
jgi:hypothetical protein